MIHLIALGREENQGVDNPKPMAHEEQDTVETSENSLLKRIWYAYHYILPLL